MFACAVVLAAAPAAQAQSFGQNVGEAVVATNEVSLSLNARETPIAIGDAILFGGRVRTGDQGVNVDNFIDGTSLSIGPNSEVLINRFVFSEAQGGEAVLNLLEGALRVATEAGGVRDLRVDTPFASTAVRGTVFVVAHDAANGTTVVVEEGVVEITNRDGDGADVDAGLASTVATPTTPPSAPSTPTGVAAAAVAEINSALSVYAGATVGAPATMRALAARASLAAEAAADTDSTSGASNFGGDGQY